MQYTNWNGANPPKRICSCLNDLSFLCQKNSIKYSLVFLSVIFILLLGSERFFNHPSLVISFPVDTLMFSHYSCASSRQRLSFDLAQCSRLCAGLTGGWKGDKLRCHIKGRWTCISQDMQCRNGVHKISFLFSEWEISFQMYETHWLCLSSASLVRSVQMKLWLGKAGLPFWTPMQTTALGPTIPSDVRLLSSSVNNTKITEYR